MFMERIERFIAKDFFSDYSKHEKELNVHSVPLFFKINIQTSLPPTSQRNYTFQIVLSAREVLLFLQQMAFIRRT